MGLTSLVKERFGVPVRSSIFRFLHLPSSGIIVPRTTTRTTKAIKIDKEPVLWVTGGVTAAASGVPAGAEGVPAVAASAAAGLVVSADGLAVAASAAAEVAVSAGGPTFAAGAAAALVAESLRAWAECRVG